jgi:hypothetical protein
MQPVPILQLFVRSDRGADPRSSELKAITLTITPPMRSNIAWTFQQHLPIVIKL